jgi:hypothetical protein
MRDKVRLFVTRRGDVSDDQVTARVIDAVQALRRELPDDIEVAAATRHPDDPTRQLANAAAMGTAAVMFDASVSLAAEEGSLQRLIAALPQAAEQLSDVIDRDQSAALAGVERVIVPGDEPLVHLFVLRRLPSISNEEFHDHWFTIHSGLGHTIPGIGAYNQFHCDADASAQAAKTAGVGYGDYDGVAETFCADLDAFNTIMTSAEVADEGISDQREFIDASRSTAALYEIVRTAHPR